jgi:hypothetical protein
LDLEDAGAGEALPDATETGLRDSDWIVVLAPPGDRRNPNVYFEVGAALGMGRPVVLVRSDGADLSGFHPCCAWDGT